MWGYLEIKRIIDILMSALACIFISPVFIFIFCVIYIVDGAFPIYRQIRVGSAGRYFTCYKFRTMVADADRALSHWQAENAPLFKQYRQGNFKLPQDPRVTPLGRFLRRHSLDELPQLFNVLRGDMALVGPRPLLPEEVADYGENIVHYLKVTPGLTGLWQVSGRSETSFLDRSDFDLAYIRQKSLWLDFIIILKTVRIVFSGRGAY
ncbi:MAG: UDP-phosphate galactosephosphotransferase/O-antigen [Rhodospirillaceae bacterium]|nr:MAG: UDP-phosphate galactosephosphotransferase/O-antigen [Rhodospirillaceae bacterium]